MDSDNKVLQALSIKECYEQLSQETCMKIYIYTHTHSAIIGQHIFFI